MITSNFSQRLQYKGVFKHLIPGEFNPLDLTSYIIHRKNIYIQTARPESRRTAIAAILILNLLEQP